MHLAAFYFISTFSLVCPATITPVIDNSDNTSALPDITSKGTISPTVIRSMIIGLFIFILALTALAIFARFSAHTRVTCRCRARAPPVASGAVSSHRPPSRMSVAKKPISTVVELERVDSLASADTLVEGRNVRASAPVETVLPVSCAA